MARWIGPRFRKPREIRHPSVSLEYLAGRRFFVSHSSHVPTPLPGLFEKKAQKRQEEETGVRTFNTRPLRTFPFFVRGGSVPLAPLSSYFHRDWPKCLSAAFSKDAIYFASCKRMCIRTFPRVAKELNVRNVTNEWEI